MERPQDMVERQVELIYAGATSYDVQPLGGGIYSAVIFADDGPDGEMQATAVATFQIRAVLIGEPVLLSVAQSDL